MKTRVTYDKAHKVYDVKVREMGNTIEIKEYSKLFSKRKDGYEAVDQEPIQRAPRNAENGIRRNNLSRSFNTLMELCFTNASEFKTFITLTFAENIEDLDVANKHYQNYLRQIKRVDPNIKIICVPEFQKRGAVHYHLMTNIPIDSALIVPQENVKNCYNAKYWNKGFSSVFDLKLTDDKFSVSLYLAKYFWKDIDNRLFGRTKIMYTQNLKKATTYEMLKDSDDYKKYQDYVTKNYKLTKEKDIQGDKPYMPNMTIYTFNKSSE